MTQREIRPTPDGFIVVEMQPKVIATFVDENHARLFCETLEASSNKPATIENRGAQDRQP